MKMLKKLTSLVLVVAFMFTMIPLSAIAEGETESTPTEATSSTSIFADVNNETRYKDAIEDLYNRKIVDGYLDENGVRTFKPEATITRGEFAKLLAVALPSKITLNMTEKSSGFADIDTDPSVAWTIPYVKAAVNASVVNGYPDGTFKAQNTVTYAEAVKMVVCAMGYANKVEQTDPWYTGYITIADQLKVRSNANGNGDYNAQASRGLVAQLIINMVTSNHIIANVVPGINDNTAGNNGMGNFIDPDEDEESEEETGLMIAAFDYSLTGDVDELSRTQVLIDDVVYEIGTSKTIDEMKELVGYEVEFEYVQIRSNKTILSISKMDVSEFEILKEDIIYSDSTALQYEEDAKEKKIKFTDDTYYFYNNEPTGDLSSAEIEEILDIENGYIRIIDNGSNKTADVVYIHNYKTFFVGGKDSSSNTVTDMYTGERIILGDPEEEESDKFVFYLCDNAGKLSKSSFNTITKNSVLSIAQPYIVTDDSVTEVIISKRTVRGDVTKKGDDYYTITSNSKDTKYYTTLYYEELVVSNPDKEIKVGSAGTYYLDYKGKIVSTAISDTLRYGYIVDVVTDDGTDPIIRMITSTNKNITEFTLNKNVTINGERGNSRKKVVEHLENSAEVINDGSGKYEAGYADSATYSQPIIFETTSSTGTVISSIKTVTEDNADGSLEYDLGRTTDGEKLTYYTSGYSFKNSSNERVFSMTFSSSSDYKAKIFVVPADRSDEDEYGVYTTNSYFKNGTQYVVDAFNVDPTNRYGNIIVVYGGAPTKIDGYNKACIVTNITPELNEDNEKVKRLYYMELGTKDPEVKNVLVEDVSLISGIKNGDIIKFATKNDAGLELVLVERVFVNEEIYEAFDEDLEQDTSDDYTFIEKYGTDTDYFNALVGRVFSSDETTLQLIKGYEIDYEEDDPEIDEVYDSADPYTVSGTATYVMVVNSKKINNVDDEGNNEGIKYYLYNAVTLSSITSNGLGIEDFVYAQRNGTGRITGLVIYR